MPTTVQHADFAASKRRAATQVQRVYSKDGTPIAFNRIGRGPAVILVDGALCYRHMGPSSAMALLLSERFTVITYDRRGRGESGDTNAYQIEREVEDIDALVHEAGGSAFLWGTSSGAVLALDAASRLPLDEEWSAIDQAIADGRRGDAVKHFLRSVGVPGVIVTLMRLMPMWSKLESVAHTLRYDGALVRNEQRGRPLDANRWWTLRVPVLVADGAKSPAWLRNANRSLAAVLANAEHRTIAGQTHMLKAQVHAPIVAEFFARG
jgi:pimeloyl-ACP methyl ester carboxylesterase